MQKHVGKYFARIPLPHPPPTLGMGSVGQNSTYSEYGHVAYQMKQNKECSKMVANILPADPLPHPGPGDGVNRSIIYFFLDMVKLHIKLNRITTAAT